MRKYALVFTLLALTISTFHPIRPAFANESPLAYLLIGKWKIVVRSVDASGKPCPFIPESIEFFTDQTLVLSNIPGQHLPYKTNLSAEEKQAIEARFPDFKGKQILLIKPNPRMDWRSTPMVYVYSIDQKELTLTVKGWEPAKFRLVK